MARSEAGRLLTEQHRQGQLRIRAQALRDYLLLWPIWQGDEDSFAQMAAAAVILVSAYHGLSSNLAGSYFESFRMAEGIPGQAVPRLAGPIDKGKATAGLLVTGRDTLRDALSAGRGAEDARGLALTRTSGSVSRQVLNGGRETIFRSVEEDTAAVGWARVTDGNPCAFCAMLAGRGPVYKGKESADFQAHDHCVPAGTLVDGPLPELGFRRWYEGELVVIRLAGGGELSITPNHPVLTDRGWVEAGLLNEGEHVVQRAGVDLDALRVPHENDVPTPIEDVWGASSMNRLRTVPVSPEDFHGDGRGSQGNVEVKATDRFLAGVRDSALDELIAEPIGAGTGFPSVSGFLAGKSQLAAMLLRLLASSPGGMGVRSLIPSLLGSEGRHVQDACLLHSSPLHPGLAQPTSNYRATNSVEFSEGLLGSSGTICISDIRGDGDAQRAMAAQLWPRFNPPPLESEPDLLRAKADLGASLLKRLSGGVELCRVVQLRRVGSWSGHVYNLQTVEGWYDANGIVVSNCGCTIQPAYDRTSPWPGRAREFHDLYNEATLEATEAGELHRGTSNDLLNAFRRRYEATRRPIAEWP